MKYKYTWSHLKLFAQICGFPDSSSSIGENWVKILEKQQEQVFPFTLWPLTYRTSTLMASPAILTPSVSNINTQTCEMIVKLYRSNEVIVICFIHQNQKEELCNELCSFNSIGSLCNDGHNDHISHEKIDEALVKCGMLYVYNKLKKKVMKQLNKYRRNTDNEDEISCIICTGFGTGGAMANFMAMDLSSEFRDLQDFMEQGPQIIVDCVTFSSPDIGNTKYWHDFESLVDGHINVQHAKSEENNSTRNSLIIGDDDDERTILMGNAVNIETYIYEIDKKIII